MTQLEFALAILEGNELLGSLKEWEKSVCTFIADSPFAGESKQRVKKALIDYVSVVGKELDITIGAYVQGLVESRST